MPPVSKKPTKRYVIIVAGGSGKRMNSGTPKQFHLLNGRPVLFHTIQRFNQFDASIRIILVLPRKYFSFWKKLCRQHGLKTPHKLVAGGKERYFSVKNGLGRIKENSLVAIHDGVRPFVSSSAIERCFSMAAKKGNAIPVIPIAESIRRREKNGSSSVNRNEFFIVQTPQCFWSEDLKKAYSHRYSAIFTDDATVVEKSGVKIHMVEGNLENIKITSPLSMKMAELVEKTFEKP